MADQMRRTVGRIAPIFPVLVLCGLIFNCPSGAEAQTWNGSASDLWGTAANWTPNTVPNSTTATVTINSATNNPVLINVSPTIANLRIGSTNSATLDNGNFLTIAGGASAGSLDIAGTLTIGSTGSFTDLILGGTSGSTVTLSGGGTLSLSGNFNNRIYSTAGDTLVNSAGNTIQGSGQIGINDSSFAFTLNNAGTINANQSAPLQIAPTNTVTNTGTLEATNGGTLDLIGNFTNTGSVILSTGSNSVVELNGSTINNGTLTTSGGGTLQNSGLATLNSVTISSGSTFTAVNGSVTTMQGTVTNNGTILLNSTGAFTDMQLNGAVTLAGNGTLTMSNEFTNRIYGLTGTESLTNGASHTIQGAGQIGINDSSFGFTLTNNGTIIANQTAALTIAPSLNTTNNGTFQANSGSTLFLNGTLTNYSPTTSTLTGGTYNAFSGTIELSQASAAGGNVFATNAANIVLDGSTAKIADGTGADILRGFLTTNTAAGSFTIQNGANLTTASSGFTNSGTVNIGASSTFTVGGSNDYVQSGGTTSLVSSSSGLTVASGHSVDINGGTLQGFGTITGNLLNAGGTIMPGVAGTAGVLTVTGNYTDPPSHFDIQIGGSNQGTDYSFLNLGGTATLNNGTLDLSLLNGFTPLSGEQFVILTSSGLSGQFIDDTIQIGNVIFNVEYSPQGFANDVVLNATVVSVPEPASLAMLGIGLAGVGAYAACRHHRAARQRT